MSENKPEIQVDCKCELDSINGILVLILDELKCIHEHLEKIRLRQ